MKINKLQINSYGKIKNKEIDFNERINIIHGKNESGKSTILKFITNSLYGISKNKNGREYSDFEKYKPWQTEEFSGKIEYELDNNEKYEVFRDFRKKNPQIFNKNKEDISKQFNIDKNKGNEFFYEQTKIDEDLFLSTLAINQNEVKLEEQSQNFLIQKIANLSQTGDDNTSFKKVIDRLNRRQLDEVGTERSREKPINVINRNIQTLEKEKVELEKYKNFKYEFEEEENNLEEKILELENENNILNEIKKLKEKEKIEIEKNKIKENIKKENIEKINLLENKINELKINNKNILEKYSENNLENNTKKIKEKNNKKIKNKNKLIKNNKIKKLNIIYILLIIINIIQFIFVKNNYFKYIFLLTVPTFLIFYIFFINNENKKIKNKEKIEKNNYEKIKFELINLENEKKLLENNSEKINEEINKIKNDLILKINLEKEKIKNNYKNKIEKNKLNIYLEENNLEKINYELENLQREINNKKLKLHSLELDRKNIEPKLENLAKIEEELVDNNNKMLTLQNLNMSINLAKTTLNLAYEKMKNSVTPRFTENLSYNISKITNDKYKKVMFNENEGLIVELENGDYEAVNKFSVGTIDQLYLSLRLSMIDELSDENVPILLDEAFAFYDDKRLQNILLYLNNEFSNRQIIIFTCTNREKDILEKNNIKFNKIEL